MRKAQAAIEYAIAFVVFTALAVFFWNRFIKSEQDRQPTVVERYVDRVEERIK